MDYQQLSTAFWDFLEQNEGADPSALALAMAGKQLDWGVAPDSASLLQFALIQLTARQKTKDKLPNWLARKKLLFPSLLAVQQASSERTARYKAATFLAENAKLSIDLTGGLGVDSWAFAQKAQKHIYIEQQPDLVALARHNFEQLAIQNCRIIESDSTAFLSENTETADLVYFDPYRRDDAGKKIFRLVECSPNVVELIPILKEKTRFLLIKTAPLLDAHQAYLELEGFSAVHILAVQNEVKELLIYKDLEKIYPKNPDFTTHVVDFQKAETESFFSFESTEETNATAEFTLPNTYLYEPSAALLKSGAFKLIAERFVLKKLHPNSHLYTSETLHPDFQGRCFQVVQQVKYNRKAFSSVFFEKKANIATRNFPDSVALVRKKLKLSDGGQFYIFATTLIDGQLALLICEKVA